MKRQTRQALNGMLFAALVTAGMVVAASASTLALTSSPEIPAAEGTAKMRATSNQNTEIRLKVKHLAPPERIATGTAVFVVWVRDVALGSQAQNLGALRVNKALSGKLRAITALKAFDLFITCEALQTGTAPTGKELLPVHYTGE